MRATTILLAVSVMLAAAASPFAAHSASHDKKAGSEPIANEAPDAVVGEAYGEAEAKITAIDKDSREVTLQPEDGEPQVIKAPEDVDLSKLSVGDTVVFGAYQRVSVTVLPAGSVPLGTASQSGMTKAAPGETPGRTVGERVTIVAEVAAVDADANTLTLRGADGDTWTLDVKNPENQERLKALDVGDLVRIDVVELVAASLKPKK